MVAQKELKELEAIKEKLEDMKTMLTEHAAKAEYIKAAAVQKDIKSMADYLMEAESTAPSQQLLEVQKKLPETPAEKRDSTGEAIVILDELLTAKAKTLKDFLTGENFKGAAVVQKEVKEIKALKEELSAKKTMMTKLLSLIHISEPTRPY